MDRSELLLFYSFTTSHNTCPWKKIAQLASDTQIKPWSSIGISKHADSTPWSMSGNWNTNIFCMVEGITDTLSQATRKTGHGLKFRKNYRGYMCVNSYVGCKGSFNQTFSTVVTKKNSLSGLIYYLPPGFSCPTGQREIIICTMCVRMCVRGSRSFL